MPREKKNTQQLQWLMIDMIASPIPSFKKRTSQCQEGTSPRHHLLLLSCHIVSSAAVPQTSRPLPTPTPTNSKDLASFAPEQRIASPSPQRVVSLTMFTLNVHAPVFTPTIKLPIFNDGKLGAVRILDSDEYRVEFLHSFNRDEVADEDL